MHKSFFPLFALSLAGVLSSSGLHQSEGFLQWIGLLAGLLPLAIYHFVLIRKNLLTPTEIDSVYYFGFLVTVVTLVSTAISIGLAATAPNLRWILLQFGLGLVATGYALFARLHLLSRSTAASEVDLVDATQKLIESVNKITEKYDDAGYKVAAFVEQTEARMAEMEQRTASKFAIAEAKFEQRMNEAQNSFNDALAKSAAMTVDRTASLIEGATSRFSEAISLVMSEIIRVQSEAEAISFSRAAERIAGFSTEMESSISAISKKVNEAAVESSVAIRELTATTLRVTKLTADISGKLEHLQSVNALVGSLNNVNAAIEGVSKTAVETNFAFSSLVEKVTLTEESLRKGLIDPLASSNLKQAFFTAERSILSAAQKTEIALAGLEQVMLPVAQKVADLMIQVDSAIGSATTGLRSIEGRLTALDDLSSAARLAADQIKMTVSSNMPHQGATQALSSQLAQENVPPAIRS